MLTNCKGFTSKEESIKKDIMDGKAPEVILINETLLTGPRKIKSNNYLAFCKNRERKEKKKGDKGGTGEGAGAGGGVATLIAKHLGPNTVKAGEGREGDEYIITMLNHVRPALNIINIYGENENRAGAVRILEAWIRLKQDLDEIKGRGELIILMGDMNRSVGADQYGVRGNKEQISTGGGLLRDQLFKSGDYVLLNNLPQAEGGPFTWVQPGKEEVKSCLDLAIGSANLVPFIKSVVIDSQRRFTPRRVIRKAGGNTTVFTDHFSVEVKIAGVPKNNVTKEKETTWNLLKKGGWESYKRLTKEAAEKVKRVAEDEALTSNEAMDKVEAIEEGIKFKAFGKTKPKTEKKKANKATLSATEMLEAQAKVIEDEILKVETEVKGKVGRVYRMKKLITGEDIKGQEPVATRDPINNELIVEPEESSTRHCTGRETGGRGAGGRPPPPAPGPKYGGLRGGSGGGGRRGGERGGREGRRGGGG